MTCVIEMTSPSNFISEITDVPSLPGGNAEWLVNIMNEKQTQGEHTTDEKKPKIQRVEERLREIESYKKCFTPEMVSIGPYYHNEPKYNKEIKTQYTRIFVGDCVKNNTKIEDFYKEVARVTAEAKKCYAKDTIITNIHSDEEFTQMMILDGCFVMQFIHNFISGELYESITCGYNTISILRDLFLLENQLPYVVLEALMKLRYPRSDEGVNKIDEFVHRYINPYVDYHSEVSIIRKNPPHHLLDLLRTKLLTSSPSQVPHSLISNCYGQLVHCARTVIRPNQADPTSSENSASNLTEAAQPRSDNSASQRTVAAQPSSDNLPSYPPVRELKAVGIKFDKSRTTSLSDIEFRTYAVIYKKLTLPQMIIDELTKCKFLNLIAYEMCPDANIGHKITGYICLLDSLIDHADDVKELRSKEIIINCLGSNEEVANLFNELGMGLLYEPQTYEEVIRGIHLYYKNKTRVLIGEFLHTHFNRPWTAIGFFAGICIISLAATQTYFTIH